MVENEVIMIGIAFVINYLTLYKYSRFLGSIAFLILSITILLTGTTEGIKAISIIMIIISLILTLVETMGLMKGKSNTFLDK